MLRPTDEEKTFLGFAVRGTMYYVLWVIVIALVFGVLGGIWHVVQLRVEREAARNSVQRLESITGSLRADYAKWQELDTQISQYKVMLAKEEKPETQKAINDTIDALGRQQKALVKKMHTDADTLPPGAFDGLPTDIQTFLKTH